jgi:hypothetical protein
MSTQTGNAPWGDAFAPEETGSGNTKKTIWVELGPVWKGESGAFSFTLRVEPLHWREFACERRVVIRERETEQQRNARQSRDNTQGNQRGGNRR